MSHYLNERLRYYQQACCFRVQSCCSPEARLCAPSYSYSAQDAWCWSFLLMSPKHFTCFLGCIGGSSTASVTTSISGALFSVLPCYLLDVLTKRRAERPS